MRRERGLWIFIAMLMGITCLSAALSPAQAQGPFNDGQKILEAVPLWSGPLPDLRAFTHQVHNGRADQIVGLYVPGLMALRIELQPAESLNYITDDPDSATLFSAPLPYGTVGLLAHSHLAGAYFTQMDLYQRAILIYGDGRQVHYQVHHLESYQALEPDNPYSTFVSLQDGSQWSSQALFDQLYASGQQLVLQTCLEQNGQTTWGRLFVIATPSLVQATLAFSTAHHFEMK